MTIQISDTPTRIFKNEDGSKTYSYLKRPDRYWVDRCLDAVSVVDSKTGRVIDSWDAKWCDKSLVFYIAYEDERYAEKLCADLNDSSPD